MRKNSLLFSLTSLLFLFFFHYSGAQAKFPERRVPPPHIPKPPPPPHVNKYKKVVPVKVDPYRIDTLLVPIPMTRTLWHDKIDKEQGQADLADGKADKYITYAHDSVDNAILTMALLNDVDSMQIMIENMPTNGRDEFTTNQQKIRYLRAVWEMMRGYNRDRKPDAMYYNHLVANMHGMLVAANENKLTDFVKANVDVYSMENGQDLFENNGEARAYLYTEMGKAQPVMMVKRLNEFAKDTFAQGIITGAVRLVPDVVFSYATSTNFPLKNAVYQTKDSLTQAIVQIASFSKSPLKALPFLGDVYDGSKTVAGIDSMADQPDSYYQGLVRLKMTNEPIAKDQYVKELEYRSLKYYVRQMNELHEAKDDVRFKCIDSLQPTGLYYLLVNGQDEIYTSTFLGTFKRLVERMKPMKGDALLDTLRYDHFRTFIRMCAGYNTLSDYLATIDDTGRNNLMSRFIGGLQKGKENELEDAVDVADAFGSIRDSALAAYLQKKVKENYEQSYKDGSKKGMIIYSLLSMLFEGNSISNSDTGASVASARLHLPSINKVPYTELANDSGIVYQQAFFFGDKDGQDSYDNYLEEFKKDNKWKIVTDKNWVTISTVTGKKIVIYANLPLKEPEDEEAQNQLTKYLSDSGIHPTIMIHRGHSYHLPVTLSRLTKDVKIVVLGSCGGYHNLALVLDHSPDAHIISSKQTGVMAVNGPILKAINTRLLDGQDVNWISIWRELEDYFAKKPDVQDKFSDYVPPYKNLGAIFIKAYRRMAAPAAAARKNEQ